MATTNSTIEKIAPMFTDLLIKKIECLKTDWQKPWIASLEQGLPRNIRGTLYNGGNVLMLLFYTEFMKFTLPVFLTFNQAKEEDLSVSKGARSFPEARTYVREKYMGRRSASGCRTNTGELFWAGRGTGSFGDSRSPVFRLSFRPDVRFRPCSLTEWSAADAGTGQPVRQGVSARQ